MFYGLARFICRFYLLTFRRWKIIGDRRLPPNQGFLVVANHISYLDPIVIGCALNRRIYFIAKAELFNIPVLSLIIKKLGAFPVQREGPDRTTIRRALKLLDDNNVVGIFPEGTRSKTGELLDPHLGAAVFATRAGVPIIPVAVYGTAGFFSKIKIVFGKPVRVEKREKKYTRSELKALSEQVMAEIAGLMALAEK